MSEIPLYPRKYTAPGLGSARDEMYRGTSLIRNRPPPKDRHRSLGMVLL